MGSFSKIIIMGSIILVMKLYMKLTTGWDRSPTCLMGKTAIVTGANKGINYHTALNLAKRGARVIVTCCNKEKAEKTKDRIVQASDNKNVMAKVVDFSSLASVRKFANEIMKTEDRLDILVNSESCAFVGNKITPDGLQLLMQVNYFSSFLLTILLLELLKNSAPSRIVNVTSSMARYCHIDTENLNAYPNEDLAKVAETRNYCNSMTCKMYFTLELSKRLKGTGVTVNCGHPGIILTELFPSIKKTISGFANYLCKTAEEAAQTIIYLAVSKDVEDTTGVYYRDCTIAKIPVHARSPKLLKTVWEKSEECVKLTEQEKRYVRSWSKA